MSESVKMTLGVSLLLDEVVRKLLYAKKTEADGTEVIVDRELPFRLRYRLNKNKMMLDKDVEIFNQRKLLYLAQFGETSEDGKNVVIKDEEKMAKYREAISALVDTEVSHNLVSLEPEDIELVKDPDIYVAPEAMTLFIGYLTNDPELDKDLSINVVLKELPKEETPVIVEDKAEAPVETVAEKPVEKEEKKPATKKTTTAKKTTGEKKTSTTKKTTTKKTTTKKETK